MRPDERNIPEGSNRQHRGRFDLFYFEQAGPRSYLRFTLLGVIVFVLFIIVPVTALLTLFFINSRTPPTPTNINISTDPPAPSPANLPVLRQPPPRPPQPLRTPRMRPPPTLPALNNNAAAPLIPGRTPLPSPPASPP